MAFDLYGDTFGDPFGSSNPFMARRQPAMAPTVLPQDESSLLGGMMERGLGGLAYLGKVLDKTFGGRAVRGGILGGNPRELLSVLPFSDSLGLTDETQTVHGKDLLTDAGFLTKGDDGWMNTIAGVGADIALDPAMWVGAAVPRAVLGGLNRVGQPLAQTAGSLTQRATFGMVNPYTAAQKLGDTAGRVGNALFDTTVHGAWSRPVQELSREVYDPALRLGQQGARDAMAHPLVELAPYARKIGDEPLGRALIQNAEGYVTEASQALRAAGLTPQEASHALSLGYGYADKVRKTRDLEIAKGIDTPELLDVPYWQTDANQRLVTEPANAAKAEANRLFQIAQKTNDPADIAAHATAVSEAKRLLAVPPIYDTTKSMPYFPRTPAQWPGIEKPIPTGPGASGGLTAVAGPMVNREIRGMPGGTEGINQIVKDARFSGRDRTLQDLQVEDEMLRQLTGGIGNQSYQTAAQAGFKADEIAWNSARGQAKSISDWLRELPPQAREHGMFTSDFVGAGFSRLNESARMQASADGVMEGAVKFARPVKDLEAEGKRFVRIEDLFSNAGLTHADPHSGGFVANSEFMNRMGMGSNAMRDLAIPADVAQDMARLGRAYTTPGVLAPVVEAWDKVTNLFKTALTTVFPAFHSRNLMSGMFNQWRDGALSQQALGEALSVIRGGHITPETAAKVFPGMSVEQATNQLLKEAIANKVAFVRESQQTSDAVGALASRPGGMLPSQVPAPNLKTEYGLQQVTPSGTTTLWVDDPSKVAPHLMQGATIVTRQKAVPRPVKEDISTFAEGFKGGGPRDTTWRKSPKIAGVNGETDTFVPVVQGRKLGNTVEDFNRLSHYLSRRTMGDSPEAASLAVKKYQIDYSNMTNFEQAVMKRMLPWYSFSSRNLPPLLSDLATKPAKLAATTRAVTGTREPGEFVPPWIAEGAATPIEGAPEGQKRFISSFGLPMEDEGVKTLGALMQGDVSRVFQQMFGMAQPFVKLPAELATGTQMYSGRKLEDLRPYEFATLGGLVPQDVARQASQVIANTPLSRFGSTFDKFIDDRKDLGTSLLNTATGVRVTDVDVAKVQERAAQEQLKKMLRGQPGIKTRDEVYVPREQLPLLSEEDAMTYSLLKEIEARSQKRARDAKKAGQ